MKKKNSLILDDEFMQYCELNNIKDTDKLAKKIFNQGFSIEKYGEIPNGVKPKETVIEKEIIKEVIKEIEVIKEVPVEKIIEKVIEVEVIKEVPIKGDTTVVTKEVIKEVKVTDNAEIERLLLENKKLSDELNKITSAMEKFNKAKYHKSSNLTDLYDE